jgi:hypothetical protein
MLASSESFADYPGHGPMRSPAAGFLGARSVAGANRATAKALSPVPRIPVING